MPIFLILSSGVVLAMQLRISSWCPCPLPPVVREGLVGLGHAVYIVAFLDRPALHVGGVVEFVGQLFRLALLRPRARVGDDPAHGQRRPPVLRHFDRHLIVGAAHPPRFHFQHRLGVLHGLLERLQRIVAGALLDLLHGVVEDSLRGVLLALPHHGVHKLLDQGGILDRIRRYFTNFSSSSAWHTLT